MPLYDVRPKRITSLSDRGLASGYPEGFKVITTGVGYSIESTVLGGEWNSTGSSDLIADRPSAALFGKGEWTVGGRITYKSSNGRWSDSLAIRNADVRCISFGDSSSNITGNTGLTDIETINIAFPGSGLVDYKYLYLRFGALPSVYPRAIYVRNFGIDGQKLTQMLARDEAVVSTDRRALSDAISVNADVILLEMGINDLQDTFLTETEVTQAIIDAHMVLRKQVYKRALQSGAVVIDCGIAGYKADPPVSVYETNIQAALLAINTAASEYISSLNNPKLWFSDPLGVTCSSIGSYITDLSIDGIHKNTAGGYAKANAIKPILEHLFGHSQRLRYPGLNTSTRPYLLATATTGQGVVASGFTIAATNCTATGAAIETVDDVVYQTCNFTATGGTLDGAISPPTTATLLDLVDGNSYGFELDYILEATNFSFDNSGSVVFSVKIGKTGNGSKQFNYSGDYLTGNAFSGHFSSPIIFPGVDIVDTSVASISVAVSIPNASISAGNIIKLSVGNARLVKM